MESKTFSGFLPETCVEVLPGYYQEWESLSKTLAELNQNYRIRREVEKLKPVSCEHLKNEDHWRRAYVVLGQLVHSYVYNGIIPWNEKRELVLPQSSEIVVDPAEQGIKNSVPRALAKPWVEVCKHFDIKPILTATGTDCWNFKLLDPARPMDLNNLSQISSMTGLEAEKYFHMIPVLMHYNSNSVVSALCSSVSAISKGDNQQLENVLQALHSTLKQFSRLILQIEDTVNRVSYFQIYRPYLQSFHDLVLEGVKNGEDMVVQARGPSAGQSSDIILFDVFLGIEHFGEAKSFREEMLGYIPQCHRQIIMELQDKLKNCGNMLDYTRSAKSNSQVKQLYRSCLQAFYNFRKVHYGIADKYLRGTAIGTGDSDFRCLLQSSQEATHSTLLKARELE